MILSSSVIPGRREAASPEPKNTGLSRLGAVRVLGFRAPVRRTGPGMTCVLEVNR